MVSARSGGGGGRNMLRPYGLTRTYLSQPVSSPSWSEGGEVQGAHKGRPYRVGSRSGWIAAGAARTGRQESGRGTLVEAEEGQRVPLDDCA